MMPRFPATRFQGSKRKILPEIAALLNNERCDFVIDLYSGSGIVSLLFRYLGKTVLANDYLKYNQNTAGLFLTFSKSELAELDAEADLNFLLRHVPDGRKSIVSDEFAGVYFTESENAEIDNFCHNINEYAGFKKSLYIYAVGQALIKKRPYNLFHRANLDMRLKDVKRSFGNARTWETAIGEHALKCIKELAALPELGDKGNKAISVDTANIESFPQHYDIVYMDPPYINGKLVPVNYSNFYHFLEGLCNYELYLKNDKRYPHRPIVNFDSAWHKRDSALAMLERICKHFSRSTIIMSYRSDGVPTPDEMAELMRSCGRTVEVHSAGEYQYALSKNNLNEEIFIIARP
ncbi:type II restriction endonuclease subunit M [Candidatus Pantoea deserta]|uniref:site-specific DNA-methyltransferase (adenine-specific) n=1 Tax=Candidatus Pantoea deserta TaxID=1869313 RepID=A0A3N4P7I9_9GAMM|nr:DNA adenine methylase [Pantoea deserta]RPE02269.1 type II restriction endonuclease subunit M [Pantoea deserta]